MLCVSYVPNLQVISHFILSSGSDFISHGHPAMQDAARELYVNLASEIPHRAGLLLITLFYPVSYIRETLSALAVVIAVIVAENSWAINVAVLLGKCCKFH